MRSISGGEKTDPDATIKSRRFVFWFNVALTLAFLILTACFYDRGNNAVYPGAFFAAIYAFCTLVLGVKIYKARGGFFQNTSAALLRSSNEGGNGRFRQASPRMRNHRS